jgi:hypothetical protein
VRLGHGAARVIHEVRLNGAPLLPGLVRIVVAEVRRAEALTGRLVVAAARVTLERRLLGALLREVACFGALPLLGALASDARVLEGGVVVAVDPLLAKAFGARARV